MTAITTVERIDLAVALARARERLAVAGIPDASREARTLAHAVLGVDAAALIGASERQLSVREATTYADAVRRRAQRVPFARIVGRQEFWSLPFLLGSETLIPRADSETVVEAAIGQIADRAAALSLLDLGTGSGCLLLSLLSELPNAWGVGVDRSEAALAVARMNAECLGLDSRAAWMGGDWANALKRGVQFDLIVTNPPYVAEPEFAALAPEVTKFEPRLALAGGDDGLEAYRSIVPALRGLLAPGGAACLEIGVGQAGQIERILAATGLAIAAVKTDLAGVPRCVIAVAAAQKAGDRDKKTIGKPHPAYYLWKWWSRGPNSPAPEGRR